MPQQVIGIGSLPNDNTGDPLRTAFNKINEMFTEVYATLALKKDTEDVDAETAALAAADADFGTLLAGKANASALDLKANSADVIKISATQTLTLLERAQHARNSGQLVAIPFELLNPTTALEGAFEFELPRMPFDFIVQDANLVATLCTHLDPADIEFLAELNHNGLPVLAQANNVPLPVNGVCPMEVVADERRIAAGTVLKLTITATTVMGSASGLANGLTLWLRGIWGNATS
jgi:hypothetical protein